MDTTVINKTDKYLDNYLRTDKLTVWQTLHGHNDQTPTDKKENKKIPPFAFLKISFSQRTFGTLAFAPNRTSQRRAKAKEPNLPTLYCLNLKIDL